MVNQNTIELFDISHKINKVQQRTYFVSKYIKQLGPLSVLEKNEEVKLIHEYKSGNEKAFQKLILCNQYIVIKEVLRVANQCFEIMDLIQFANLALIDSLKSDNIDLNGLKSYLHRNIFRKLQNYIFNNFSIIKYPQNRINELLMFNRYFVEDNLINQSTLIKYLEKPDKQKERSEDDKLVYNNFNNKKTISLFLSMLYYRYDKFDLNSIGYTHLVDHAIFEQSLLIEINNQLKSLKKNEPAVIKMYFGLDRENAMTLNEIGEELNLTRERVRQIKEKALAKLAHSQRIKILEPLYNEVLTRTEQPFYNQSIGGWLLDPYMNYTNNDEDSILMLEEYIKGSKRVQFIKGIHNLTKHYQSLIPSILNKIGHITLKRNIIKRIKSIDGIFNSTIFDYSIRTSKNIKIVNDYIGLKKHFEDFDD